jgi:hypothetical protein
MLNGNSCKNPFSKNKNRNYADLIALYSHKVFSVFNCQYSTWKIKNHLIGLKLIEYITIRLFYNQLHKYVLPSGAKVMCQVIFIPGPLAGENTCGFGISLSVAYGCFSCA